MATIISGRELSKTKKANMTLQVEKLENKYGRRPKLSVILVGDDPGSVSYVTGKEKACNEIGIINQTIRLPEKTTQDELLNVINGLNNDPLVDGILIQLPLPKQINQTFVINSIDPSKDVDGFHPVNVASPLLTVTLLFVHVLKSCSIYVSFIRSSYLVSPIVTTLYSSNLIKSTKNN